jgi:hypothetical protein
MVPFVVLIAWPIGNLSAAHRWEKIPAEQIGAKPETSEATEAGAEVLLAKHRLSFNDSGITNEDFHRTIVYDERAAESVGRIKITVNLPAVLNDCGARVTRADGTVREYEMKDFSRTKAVERGRGGAARSGFAVDDNDHAVLVSGVELYQLAITDLRPGDLVEYYHRIDEDMGARNGYAGQRLIQVQEPFPIRSLSFTIGSEVFRKNVGYETGLSWCNLPNATKEKDGGSQLVVRATNIPAYRRETDALPDQDIRAYIILRLASGNFSFSFENWKEFTNYLAGEARSLERPTSAMKKLAAQIVAGAGTSDEKLRRLYDYCQKNVTNYDYEDLPDGVHLSNAERRELTPTTALELHCGSATVITRIFVALARASGLDATLALTTRSNSMLRADRAAFGWEFMNEWVAAVQLDGKWHYYAPGMRWAPFGQLYWQDQGTAVLLVQNGKAVWAVRPVVTDTVNDVRARKGQFKLSEQGALTGTVTETLSGQYAMSWRLRNKVRKPANITAFVRAEVRREFASAELSHITIEDDRDNTHPVLLHYSLRVPDFATLAGGRIIFGHDVLNARATPRYTSAEPRLQPIRFQGGSTVHDRMEIELPEGYELEAGDAPQPVDYADKAGIKHAVVLVYVPAKNLIRSDSTLSIGLNGKIIFPAKSYAPLKAVFEQINKAQTHTLVLKPKPGHVSAPAVPAATPAPEIEQPEEVGNAPEA